jgi:hypothetical protein
MDDTPAKETPGEGLNKIDLSQLQDFRFGTQWTEIKSVPGQRREPEGDRPPRRDGGGRGDGRPRGGGSGEPRRDRRMFQRPGGEGAGANPPGPAQGRPGGEPGAAGRPAGDQRPAEGQWRGRTPEREGGGERRWSGSRAPQDYRPYLSPYFNIAFYPDDAGFSALVKAMRASCRTFELFEIARLILGKNDRFVVVVTRRPPDAGGTGDASSPASSASGPAGTGIPIFLTLVDGVPFDSEEEALAHALGRHLDRYFDKAEVEVEAPKGSFPFVNRCTLSGELLGPPNYHRYQQIVQQHHAARFSRMPLDQYRERIETVRDPEVVNQWLEKMKKATRYTWKLGAEGEPPVTFDSVEEARAHLRANARDRVVKTLDAARFSGKLIEALPPGEIRRAIEGHLERQRRFPLDTANALRGRLRREGFTIFKKGSKGISYVCAVKRKFRVAGQSFAESIGTLIGFVEANPMITVRELPLKLLGFAPPSVPSTPPIPVPAELSATAAPATEPVPAVPAESALTAEQQEKLKRVTMDLHWLVHEGYVTEFADGRMFTPPPMAEARVRATEAAEGEEPDLENFPEIPVPAPVAAAEPTESPAPESAESTSPAPAPEDPLPIAEPAAVPAPLPVEAPVPDAAETPAAVETPSTSGAAQP